ncbi:hypothetical protein HY085_03320, partial [Candidatus Gottesmanbacteria bacterium]|nr:hypothetical protein [Candidatus Gottesmanbacteria bacterium]
ELPNAKFARFIKQYKLSPSQAELLTREKNMADSFEELAKKVNPKNAANSLINKRPLALPTKAVDEKELEKIIQQVLDTNPKAVKDYKNGKIQILGFLIGEIVKLNSGLDRIKIIEILKRKLK